MTFDDYRREAFSTSVRLIVDGAFDHLANNPLAMEVIWSDSRLTGESEFMSPTPQIDAAHRIVDALEDSLLQEHLEQLEIDVAQYDSDLVELDKLIRSLAFQLEWNEIEELWLRRASMLASLKAGEPAYFFDQIPAEPFSNPHPSPSDRRTLLYDSSGFPIGNLTSFI